MVTHHTSNGCNLRPGDLLASGTVSGPEPDARGCLLELTWRGERAAHAADRRDAPFLEDGDEVILRGRCERDGFARDRLRRVPRSFRRATPREGVLDGAVAVAVMAKVESLGIKRIESVHYYVHDLERSRRFYAERLDFAEIGGSAAELTSAGRAASRRVPGRRLRRHLHRPAGRGRPRLALPAQAPRRRRHAGLRGRGHRAHLPRCSRSAAARPSTTSQRFDGRRRRRSPSSRSPRRSATPPSASSSAAATARSSPASRPTPRRAAARTASASALRPRRPRTSRP